MSLTSWINEFYPLEAGNCSDDDEAMLRHSIRKWTGALTENLSKHDMAYIGVGVLEERCCDGEEWRFVFNATSCALCLRYLEQLDNRGVDEPNIECEGCLLCELQGGPCCYVPTGQIDAYEFFLKEGDPKPMLEALSKCLEIVIARSSPTGAKEKQ